MDLRKATCSECKSHLHYMENMSVKKNGVTMHFGDRFCMGGKEAPKVRTRRPENLCAYLVSQAQGSQRAAYLRVQKR